MSELSPGHILALDIGGSHAVAAVVSQHDRAIVEASRARRATQPDAPADALLGAWAGVLGTAYAGAGAPPVARLGVAMPGPFDYARGVSLLRHKFASLLGSDVGAALSARWAAAGHPPVAARFGNDATLFALGEWWAGAARGHDRVLGITLGTGLGAGFVAGGEALYGGEGVPPDGGLWDWPYRDGIAEDYVSGRAVSAAYAAASGSQLDAAEIARRATAGDDGARAAFGGLGDHLGQILAPWVGRFAPGAIVVGGNIARAWPLFAPALEARLGSLPVALRRTELFEDASLLGAAALCAPL
ncbi:ROK family protein [Kouleothrix sp.]|uniref:ROK family protein n=1 Tax=Kouleothrix sp. TaxID=2779161 RepID=UPI00391A2D38